MNLHRTTGRPDWEDVTISKRNKWQNLAAGSHSIASPGNVITLIGLVIVFLGLYWLIIEDYWLAVTALAFGRALDLLDGWAADATGTKSPLGEAFDAAADKITTFFTLGTIGAAQLCPWWLILSLLLPHLAISILAFAARRTYRELHPSRIGKISMAAAWTGLFGIIILAAIGPEAVLARYAVYGLCVLSSVMGLAAAAGYLKQLSPK